MVINKKPQKTKVEINHDLEDIKSDFITIASHQLRTPISAVRWSLDTLLSGRAGRISPKQEEVIKAAYQNNNFLVKVVNDLLRVSRIEEKGVNVLPEYSNIVKLTKELIKKHEDWARASNCQINLSTQNNLSRAYVDSLQIRLIFDDLIDNAIRYSRGKGLIKIKLFNQKNYLVFEILDSGIGIPSDQAKLVFGKFFRGRNAMRAQTEGLGLDLYLAKKILEASGGKIAFATKENQGTKFNVFLPIDKKQYENVLIKDKEAPENLLKKEREFVTITVHELKAPLAITKWSLETLKSQKPGRLNESQLELIDQIYRGNERLLVLVRDLLNLAKLQEGKFEVNLVPLEIKKIISDVVLGFKNQSEQKFIKIDWRGANSILPKVKADEARIAQVLTNLMSNAIKYTLKNGKVTLKIEKKSGQELKNLKTKTLSKVLHFKNKKGYLVVSVADSGIGISLEDQRRLFTRFFRSKKVMQSEAEGTGLGLYIAKSIINLHGGDIWFESELGQGSIFYFSLPII